MTLFKTLPTLCVSALAMIAASTAQAATIFQIENNPSGAKLLMTSASNATSSFGSVLSSNDVMVTTNVAAEFANGFSTIKPDNGLLTSITFTPVSDTAFNDFVFRGQDLVANQTINVIVTDQNGVAQTIVFTEGNANANFAANGIVGLPGETIKSVQLINSGGFKEAKQFEFSVASVVAVPEPASWVMLVMGFGCIGGGLRVARAKPLATTAI
jgi:hypothetical protein